MADQFAPHAKRKRYHFLLSGFSQDEKYRLAEKIRSLKGTYIESAQYVGSSTHIVCAKPSRGEKFLCGCATGKWILKEAFIHKSFKAKKWLDEEPFEWTDSEEYALPLPKGHLSAPRRWRNSVQLQGLPYKGWSAVVVTSDQKRRNAYKRLLKVGGAEVISGKPPYSDCLAEKLTHVFVESELIGAVQGLIEQGIPCLSTDYIPEYILQEPRPTQDSFSVPTYFAKTKTPSPIRRRDDPKSTYITPVLSLRSINIEALVEAKSPSKRKDGTIKMEDGRPMPLKKVKKETTTVQAELQPQTAQLPPGFLLLSKAAKPSQFSSYITDTIEGCLEEGHILSALSTVTSYLCHQRYPPPTLLHTIMDYALLKSPSPVQANKASLLLNRLLVLHPPDSNTALYRSALRHESTEWEFVRKVIRLSVAEPVGPENAAYSKSTSSSSNGTQLLKFLRHVFERDFYGRRDEKNVGLSTAAVHPYRESLLWQMFWGQCSMVNFNRPMRELVEATWSAITCTQSDPDKIEVVYSVQALLALLAECCSMADGLARSAPGLDEVTRTLVTELSLVSGEAGRREEHVRLLLETTRPDWLRMYLADSLLRNYDYAVVPDEKKHLLHRPPSLEKIVQFCFFLMPRERVRDDDAQTTPETCSLGGASKDKKCSASPRKPVSDLNQLYVRLYGSQYENDQAKRKRKTGVNRRNVKGESQLHVACIKHDVGKVRQLLLDGADVNAVDYAGWTPLHEACNHGHVACVKELLESRPVVFSNDECKGDQNLNILAAPLDGTTPLHDAVANNHLQVAQLLVSHGGLPTLQAKNSVGKKPVEFAVESSMREFLQTAERNLLNGTTAGVTTEDASIQGSAAAAVHPPSEEAYRRTLGEKGGSVKGHVPPEKCEEFLLILSHLVQAFRGADTSTRLSTAHLESHLSRIVARNDLTPLCSLRLQGIRWFAV